jgi:hypothetical protein
MSLPNVQAAGELKRYHYRSSQWTDDALLPTPIERDKDLDVTAAV